MRIKYLLILAVMIFSCQNIYSEVMSEKEAIGFYSEAFKGRLDKQDYVELRKGKDIIDCRLLMYDRHKPYLVRFYEVENKRMLEFLGTKIRHRKYFEGKDLVDFAVELKEGDWLKIDASIKKIKGMEIKVVEEKWSHKYQLRCIYKGEEFSFEEYDDGQESAFIDFAKQMQKLVIEQFLYGPIIRWAGILYKDEMVAFYPSKKCGYIQMMGLPCDPKKDKNGEYLSIFYIGEEHGPELVRIIKDNKKTQVIAKKMLQNSRQRGLANKIVDLNKDDWKKIRNIFDKKRKVFEKAEEYNKYSIFDKFYELEIEYCKDLKCEKYISGWTKNEMSKAKDEKDLNHYGSWEFYENIKDVIFDAYERERSKKEKKQ